MAFVRLDGTLSEEEQIDLDRMKKRNKRRFFVRKIISWFIFTFCSLMGVVFIILIDKIGSRISPIDIIDNEEFFLTLFQVQSTVATLSITVISIITVIFKVRKYGVYLSRYLLFIKSGLLCNANLILISIETILLNSYFLFNNLYLASFLSFLISILLIALLIRNVLDLFKSTNSLDDEIKDYLLDEIKTSFTKIKPVKTKGDICSIEYALAENPNTIKHHKLVEQLLSDWYDDTIIKMNDNQFNEYSQNIGIIYSIYHTYDYKDNNCLKIYTLNILSQYTHEIVNQTISKAQYNLSFKTVILISGYLYLLSTNDKENSIDFTNIYRLFDFEDEIIRLISLVQSQLKLNKKYIHDLNEAIFNYAQFLLVIVDICALDKVQEIKEVEKSIINIFTFYFSSIVKNKLFGKEDKIYCFSFFEGYINEYEKKTASQYKSNGFYYRSGFFDYVNYIQIKKLINPDRFINDDSTKKASEDVNGIRKDLYDLSKRLLSSSAEYSEHLLDC